MSADDMTMNCEQCQQAIGADPEFAGAAAHVSECAACSAYRDDMQALDLKIGRALAISVPELVLPELPGVELDKVVGLPGRRHLSPPTWFALAASVMLAAVIGIRFAGDQGSAYESLADEVLAHVSHEPNALLVTDRAVPDEHLHKVVPGSVATLDHSGGLITFAEICPINGRDVPHLVIQGEHGPITILLMPEEKIDGAVTLNNAHSHGVILPVGDGSIAIVGARDEKLEEVEKQVLQSVAWRT
jgi:hypothetical protein